VHGASSIDAGRVQVNLVERGPISDLFVIFDRVARRIASAPASTMPLAEYPPVAAFESYIKGLLAESPGTATNYLRTALAAYPAYDRARLALWDVYFEMGAFDQALATVEAVPRTSTLSGRARFLAGLAQIAAKQYERPSRRSCRSLTSVRAPPY
jgi:hypothetical protein